MQYKLITAGAGLTVFGALFGWAVTADAYERKMKGNQRLLGDIIERQRNEISGLKQALLDYAPSEGISPAEIYQQTKNMFGLAQLPINSDAAAQARALIEKNASSESRTDEPAGPPDTPEEAQDAELPEEVYEPIDLVDARIRLRNLISPYSPDEEVQDEFVNRAGKTFDRDYTPPFVITQEMYSNDPDEGDDYTKLTLTWYPNHRIMTDDSDELVDDKDVDAIVGYASLNRFGDSSGDADVVFVRNRMLLTDFEVVRDEDNEPPIHVRYGMEADQFEIEKASGTLELRPEDQ